MYTSVHGTVYADYNFSYLKISVSKSIRGRCVRKNKSLKILSVLIFFFSTNSISETLLFVRNEVEKVLRDEKINRRKNINLDKISLSEYRNHISLLPQHSFHTKHQTEYSPTHSDLIRDKCSFLQDRFQHDMKQKLIE